MTCEEVRDLILREKLVVIFRGVPIGKLGEVSRALVRAGIKLVEVTFNQRAEDPAGEYEESIDAIRAAVGDQLCLGAGTVLSPEQVKAAHRAGARYIISPSSSQAVIRTTKELDMVSIPGAMTPTEITNAWDWGADIVKLFPADDLGYHYIWNLKGPLPHIPLMATGGVNPETIPKFLEQGIAAVGTGITIVDKKLLEQDDYAGIEALARKHLDVIRGL